MLSKMKFILNLLSAALVMFIITTNLAYADISKEAAIQSCSMSSQIIMMVVLFGAMYFLLIRPQNKKAKEHKDLILSLNNGDEVITVGGLLGKVIKVIDHFVVLAIADGVEVAVQKQAISQILPKGTLKSL
jgi:preprotein translocase subunit YajC